MTRQLVFDVRFKNTSNVGVAVDNDLWVDFCEEGETTPVLSRQVGLDPFTTIYQTSDAEGVLYTTVLNGATLSKGAITAKWYAKISGSPVNPYPYIEDQANIDANASLSVGEIKQYIRNMLGFPAVAVELTGPHFTAIVDDALTTYGQFIPAEKVERLGFVPNIQRYHLPHIPYNGPFDVKFVRKVVVPIASDPLFGREYLRSNDIDLGTLIMGQAYLETAMRVLSSEPDWRWLHKEKELYINIGPGVSAQVYGGYDVSIRYFVSVDLHEVREEHFRWFRKYCLAQAKKILARIRGKYSGNVPSPGGPLVLDSSDLAAEGIREEEELIDEIKKMAPHVPPMWG